MSLKISLNKVHKYNAPSITQTNGLSLKFSFFTCSWISSITFFLGFSTLAIYLIFWAFAGLPVSFLSSFLSGYTRLVATSLAVRILALTSYLTPTNASFFFCFFSPLPCLATILAASALIIGTPLPSKLTTT